MKKYFEPKINVEMFMSEDVITTSGEAAQQTTAVQRAQSDSNYAAGTLTLIMQ